MAIHINILGDYYVSIKKKKSHLQPKGTILKLVHYILYLCLTQPWKRLNHLWDKRDDKRIWEISLLSIPTFIISTCLWLEWELASICSNFWFWKEFSPTRIDTACQVISLLCFWRIQLLMAVYTHKKGGVLGLILNLWRKLNYWRNYWSRDGDLSCPVSCEVKSDVTASSLDDVE